MPVVCCKQSVDLVPVFWHNTHVSKFFWQSNFLHFCPKICVQVPMIFLSGAFKAEKNCKIHMRYPFLWYSVLSHPDIRHQLKQNRKILTEYPYLRYSILPHPDIRLIYELFFVIRMHYRWFRWFFLLHMKYPRLFIQDWCKNTCS